MIALAAGEGEAAAKAAAAGSTNDSGCAGAGEAIAGGDRVGFWAETYIHTGEVQGGGGGRTRIFM